MIAGACHCGAVRIEIAEAPHEVTDCNCSICRRLGALWAYYRPDQARVVAAPGATATYSWNDKIIAFHHCVTCGCTTHWTSLDARYADRMAINARLLEGRDLAPIAVRKFDGASM